VVEGAKGIFVSYRRDETAAYAGRLADRLVEHFDEENVFHDIEDIEPGIDFVEAIERALESCAVMLVVMSRNWVTTLKEHEQSGQEDYMRLEVATALKRNLRVVPVLVQGASIPSADELPDDLTPLTRHNAFELHDTNWQSDIQYLITRLETVTGRRQPTAGSATPIGVRPHSRPANQGQVAEDQNVFWMEQDGFYDHPYINGFLVQSSFAPGGWADQQYGVAAGMHVRTHQGGTPSFFAFEDFPKNTWASVQDNDGNPLPFAVYVQGDIGVYGKWLYPQRPPA
jgi:TIR domain